MSVEGEIMPEDEKIQEPKLSKTEKVNKWIVLHKKQAIIILLSLAITLVIVVVSKNDNDGLTNIESTNAAKIDQTTQNGPDQSKQVTDVPGYKPAITGIPGVEGLIFSVPEKWIVHRFENIDNPDATLPYSLISPEVDYLQGGYVDINDGYKISIVGNDRDSSREAKYDAAWKAYVSGIGAPKIEDNTLEYYELKTDYSKIYNKTNSNGLKFYYYTWNYEGCFVDVFAVGETKIFGFNIYSGSGCPKADIIESDESIASFINSLSYGKSTPVNASAYVYERKNNSKIETANPINVSIVHTKNVTFSYGRGDISTNGSLYLFGTPGVPKLNIDQSLKALNIGETVDAKRTTYDCPQCGFLYDIYDQSISYTVGNPDTSGYEKLSSDIYGKTTDTTPISDGNSAKIYEYIKLSGENAYFSIRFIAETLDSDTLYPMPTLNSEKTISILNTIKVTKD